MGTTVVGLDAGDNGLIRTVPWPQNLDEKSCGVYTSPVLSYTSNPRKHAYVLVIVELPTGSTILFTSPAEKTLRTGQE